MKLLNAALCLMFSLGVACTKKKSSAGASTTVVEAADESNNGTKPLDVPEPDATPLIPANKGSSTTSDSEPDLVIPTISIEEQSPREFYFPGDNIQLQLTSSESDTSYSVYLIDDSIQCKTESISELTEIVKSQGSSALVQVPLSESGSFRICVLSVFDGLEYFNQLSSTTLIIPGDMSLWLDASKGLQVSDGKVVSWTGQSSNAVVYSNSNIDQQPTVSNDSHDIEMLSFDGVNDYLHSSTLVEAKTVISSYRVDSSLQNASQLGQVWGSYNEGCQFAVEPRSPKQGFSFDGTSTSTASYAHNSFTGFSADIRNENGIVWAFDTVSYTVLKYTSKASLSGQNIGMLNASGSLHHFGGQIGEIMVFDRDLTDAEIDVLSRYYLSRWNPSVSDAPAVNPVSVSAGQVLNNLSVTWQAAATENTQYHLVVYSTESSLASCNEGTLIPWQDILERSSFNISGIDFGKTYHYRVCAINVATGEVSTGVAGSFTTIDNDELLPETDGLVFWLNPSFESSVIQESGVVSEIQEVNNGLLAMSQSLESYRPTLVDDGSGRSLLRFDGIDDHLSVDTSLNAQTAFIVFKVNSSMQQSTDLGQLWGSYTEGAHISVEPRAINFMGYSFDGSIGANQARYLMRGDASYSADVGNDNSKPWSYDKLELIQVEFTEQRALTEIVMGHLGSTFGVGDHHFGGDIAEILIYDKVLSAEELTKVNDYLTSTWFSE